MVAERGPETGPAQQAHPGRFQNTPQRLDVTLGEEALGELPGPGTSRGRRVQPGQLRHLRIGHVAVTLHRHPHGAGGALQACPHLSIRHPEHRDLEARRVVVARAGGDVQRRPVLDDKGSGDTQPHSQRLLLGTSLGGAEHHRNTGGLEAGDGAGCRSRLVAVVVQQRPVEVGEQHPAAGRGSSPGCPQGSSIVVGSSAGSHGSGTAVSEGVGMGCSVTTPAATARWTCWKVFASRSRTCRKVSQSRSTSGG